MSNSIVLTVSRKSLVLLSGLIVGCSILGTAAGVYLGSRVSSRVVDIESLKLHAGTSASGEKVSLATGYIDELVEGVYILDHLTGSLQCWVLSPKTGEISGIYRTNVNVGLETDKAGEKDYVMTTGEFVYSGGSSGMVIPARSVVYVAEGNSGNVAAFGLKYDKSSIRRGVNLEEGTLDLIGKGSARRPGVQRDQ